uniref:Uncharacterized protein n=1 Tax=Anguilla anguilla TaxID=7936 RepID=A0A0E9QUN3_ANGAN
MFSTLNTGNKMKRIQITKYGNSQINCKELVSMVLMALTHNL